jgi:hypothetical protein
MSRLRSGELREALEPMWALKHYRAQVERLCRVLLERPHVSEADEAVELLASFPAGLSGSEVTRRLHRSKAAVLHALRTDRRVEKTGWGRGSRFRLTARSREPQRTGQEPSSDAPPSDLDLGHPSPEPHREIASEEIAAL